MGSKYYLVSVIIPIYNAINFIKKCVDSLLRQEIGPIEILLIDDGSTDGSGELCDNYAKEYENIRVIHKKNGGVVSARLAGIQRAKGEYIGFVDADDWVEPNMYGVMYHHAKEYDADIVICGVFDGDFSWKSVRASQINSNVKSGYYDMFALKKEIFPFLLHEKGHSEKFGITPFLWDKLFKQEILLENIKYFNSSVHWSEDQLLTYSALLSSRRVYIEPGYFYHYIENPDSATNKYRIDFLKSTQVFFSCLDEIVKDKKRIYDLSDQVHVTKAITCMQVINNEINNMEFDFLQLYNNIKNILYDESVIQIFNKKINADFTIKTRIYCFLIKKKYALIIIWMKKIWDLIK